MIEQSTASSSLFSSSKQWLSQYPDAAEFQGIRMKTLDLHLQLALLFSKSMNGITHTEQSMRLDQLFSTYAQVWRRNEDMKQSKIEEENEMYKFKERKHDFKTDEQIENEQLALQFPDFSADFNDLLSTVVNNNKTKTTTATTSTTNKDVVTKEEKLQQQKQIREEHQLKASQEVSFTFTQEQLLRVYEAFLLIYSPSTSATTASTIVAPTSTQQRSQKPKQQTQLQPQEGYLQQQHTVLLDQLRDSVVTSSYSIASVIIASMLLHPSQQIFTSSLHRSVVSSTQFVYNYQCV